MTNNEILDRLAAVQKVTSFRPMTVEFYNYACDGLRDVIAEIECRQQALEEYHALEKARTNQAEGS